MPVWVVVTGLVIIVVAIALSGVGTDGSWRTGDAGGASGRSLATTEPAEWTPPSTATTVAVEPGPRLVFKFVDGASVRLLYGELVSLTGTDVAPVDAVLTRYPGTVIDPLFGRADDLTEAIGGSTGQAPPDMSLYYRLTLVAGADADAVLADLGGLAAVEWAYAEP